MILTLTTQYTFKLRVEKPIDSLREGVTSVVKVSLLHRSFRPVQDLTQKGKGSHGSKRKEFHEEHGVRVSLPSQDYHRLRE